jgi:hypothetical protein
VATLLLCPPRWTRRSADDATQHTRRVLIAWAATTFTIPMLMQTKVPWYLNPLYPVFALTVGLVIRRALVRSIRFDRRRRTAAIAICVLMFCLAEAKLLWYSFDKRDLANSSQALLLRQRDRLHGHQLYQQGGSRADYFVATAIVGVVPQAITSDSDFARQSTEGDYLLTDRPCGGPGEQRIDMNGKFNLCRRR